MTQREKLLARMQQNFQGIRFDEACKVAQWLGFAHEGRKGAHRVFKQPGEPTQLNFQNRDGYIPPYQARQLETMLKKYGGQ